MPSLTKAGTLYSKGEQPEIGPPFHWRVYYGPPAHFIEEDAMKLADADVLGRLGDGESIESICSTAGIPREEFDLWWGEQLASRVPHAAGSRSVPVGAAVEIIRDKRGVPHVFASSDEDLFFGYGYAMAQDRLWQLDYLRRRALGRLAEILGPDSLDSDVLVRTVGINRIARRKVEALSKRTLGWLEAFSSGVNSLMEECKDRVPIEFDLLDYRPEPWSASDTVAVWTELQWYLTGRMPVIFLPELAKRYLADTPLYPAFLTPEAGDETIVPAGSYPAHAAGSQPVGEVVGDPDEGTGSNNWVVAGSRSASGAPMVSSDPHIAFGSVSCWYEVHLSGGSFNVAGAHYVGVPGLFFFGRNDRVAWGLTNNICSQRDLYQETTDPEHPGAFLYGYSWEPARELTESIAVKGADTVTKTIRFSRNGPIVDELLPEPARSTGPISLRWLGAGQSDEITSMLGANAAGSCDEFREALREWVVPTFSFGFADVDGHIGYQSVGRIPIRSSWDRGYRPGWEPEHQWRGVVPYDQMPRLADPPQGWVRSANNRTVAEDFPYPLSGQWNSGQRARRIRQMLEENGDFDRDRFSRMQTDTLSLRAVEGVPHLIRLLGDPSDERVQRALAYLDSWDCRIEPDSVAASIFELFFVRWGPGCRLRAIPHRGRVVAVGCGERSGLGADLRGPERLVPPERSRRDCTGRVAGSAGRAGVPAGPRHIGVAVGTHPQGPAATPPGRPRRPIPALESRRTAGGG